MGPQLSATAPTDNNTCLCIQTLRGPDAVIASDKGRGGGRTGTASRQLWDVKLNSMLDGSRANRLREGMQGDHQNTPPVLREGVWDKYGCRRKGIWRGRGGRTGRVNTIFSRRPNIIELKKSKIIKGVTVSGWDTPHPPIPSTTIRTGRPEKSLRRRGCGTVRQGQPAKNFSAII